CNTGFVGITSDQFLTNLFYGVILTATSVSVTVATLKELGKLNTKVGSTLITAAILDDIIGIVVLSFVVAMKGTGNEDVSPMWVIIKTVLFFVIILISGKFVHRLFKKIETKFPHHRLLPIFSI